MPRAQQESIDALMRIIALLLKKKTKIQRLKVLVVKAKVKE